MARASPAAASMSKFVVVQGFGLVLNALFTWVGHRPLAAIPAWVPLMPGRSR